VKYTAVAMTLILSGCASGTLPWAQGPHLSESACTASCDAHYKQCPQVFAAFPERGAVECPAAQKLCLNSCAAQRDDASGGGPSVASHPAVAGPQHVVSSKETKLRELKLLYDQGLVSDDVYRERQRAILTEP